MLNEPLRRSPRFAGSISSRLSSRNSQRRGGAGRPWSQFLVPAVECLEDRTLLSHCGPFDLGDGEGPKFIGDGLTTITEDFSDNPNHEDPDTVSEGFDACEAQGEKLFTHTTVGISGIVPIVGADIPFDQVQPEMGHIFVLLGEDRIEFQGIHPDFHVAAVSVDVLASGFSTAQATVRVVGENGAVTLSPENAQEWEQVLATRGTIVPGTTDELGPIQSVSLVGTTDFSIFDNVTILIASNLDLVPNGPPNAFDDSVVVLPNYAGQPVETFAINVLANDDDPDLDPISVVSVTDPDHGTATIANDRVRYTPDIDFHGTDRFDYTIRDDHGHLSTATVNVTVNTPPTATNADFFFDHGTTGAVEIAAPGLLDQGFDADGDPLTIQLVSEPEHGTVVVNPDGSFTYRPTTPGDVLRSDVFAFRHSDGFEQSNVAQVGIIVSNQAPVVGDLFLPGQGVNFRHGTEGPVFGRFNADDADGDPLEFEIVTPPEHGAVTILSDGWFAYQPIGFSYVDWRTGEFHPVDGQLRGPDSFMVQAVDPHGARSAPATVQINVPNDPPQTNSFNPDFLAEDVFTVKGTLEEPGTAEDVFAPLHLSGSNVVLLTDEDGNTLPYDHGVPGEFPPGGSPPEGRLELLFHAQLEELRYSFELANIDNVKLVRLHLGEEGTRGPFVAVLYSAPAGNGPFPGTRQFGTVTQADLVGPYAGDFAAFAEALRAGNIYVSVFTDDGLPAPGIGEETGPGDFHLTGELRGQIRKAGRPKHFAAPGPLWNDSDPNVLGTDASGDPIIEFDPLRMAIVRGPQHGTLLIETPAHPAAPVPVQPQFSDGSFTYYPEVGFSGIDEFVYVADDGHRSSLPTRVKIDVTMPSAELAARLHDDVVQLTTQDWVPKSSENRIAHFFRKEFSVTGNDEIPASFTISGFHFREFSSTPLSLSKDFVEFGGGPRQSFVGDRYAAYGVRLDRSLSLSNSNVAAVKLVVTDLDQDGDGITDSEEGIFTRNPDAAFDPTILGTVGLDSDNDGWSNAFEANAPNGGDANFDGILDLRQPNVTSFLLVGAERVATLAAPAGTQIRNILANSVFLPDAPDGVEFPVGIIGFAIDGVFPTVPVEVELILHDEPVLNTYYKYGRTPDNPTPHWYEFLFDGRTGAELIDADADGGIERVVLHFLDGERGDNDLAFNGAIVDPGGPAFVDPDGPPAILTPIGTTDDELPTLTWTAVPAAAYQVHVYDVHLGRQIVDVTAATTSFSPGAVLGPNRIYQVFVRALFEAGGDSASPDPAFGPWSSPEYFSIDGIAVPAPPVLTGPFHFVRDATPVIAWRGVDGADWYHVQVYDVSLGRLVREFGVVETAVEVPAHVPLSPGRTYTAYARARGAADGAWAGPLGFAVTPDAAAVTAVPVLTGPTGRLDHAAPTISWKEVAGASSYRLEMYSLDFGRRVFARDGIARTYFTLPEQLPHAPGRYAAFVRADFADGTVGSFSLPHQFHVVHRAPAPAAPPVITPLAPTLDPTPTFIWDAAAGSRSFEVVIEDAGGMLVHQSSRQQDRFFVPASPLAPGQYRLRVRGLNEFDEPGAFSPPREFEILSPPLETALRDRFFTEFPDDVEPAV